MAFNPYDRYTKIVVTTRRIQNRKHKKKRINKKWGKVYGFTEYEIQEKGKIIIFNNIMYVTLFDYERIINGQADIMKTVGGYVNDIK